MIGYILIGIGSWLLYDDYKAAKAKKLLSKGDENGLHENGNDRSRGNRAGKPGAVHKKSDRNRGVSDVPARHASEASRAGPVKSTKGVKNDISQESTHTVEPNQNRDIAGDNRAGESNAAPVSNQGETVTK